MTAEPPTVCMAARTSIRTKLLPPASTTPASLRTASSSGVRASAASPSSSRRCMNPPMWAVSVAARSAAATASRATVRMVPSRGSSSDS